MLEDSIYRVKRKNCNQQQRSDKSKRVRREVCEQVCETDRTGAETLTTLTIDCMNQNKNTNGSTQYTDFSHVKISSSSKCESKNQEKILNLNPPNNAHIASEKIKLANGKHGRISEYFPNVVRHSGVNLGSPKLDNARNLS